MTMKKSTALVLGALLLPVAVMAQNIATVNGKPVPKSRVDQLLAQAAKGQPVTPELEQRAKENVVLREILMQAAMARGVGKSKEFADRLEFEKQNILIGLMFEKYQKDIKISDADAKARYEELKGQQAGTEYHAHHILVESEDEAKKLIADIKAGAKFEDLAKKVSKDPGSKEDGGDLPFTKPDNWAPEFAAAVMKLKKGEMTDAPVKTSFGWHIIRVDDTRQAEFPAFDDVKPRIVEMMTQQKMVEFQDSLRKGAKTDFKFARDQKQTTGAPAPAGKQ